MQQESGQAEPLHRFKGVGPVPGDGAGCKNAAFDARADAFAHVPFGKAGGIPRQKGVYEVDPLVCPKCKGPMKIISFIEDLDLIEKILCHLGLWDTRNHDPPEPAYSNTIPELIYDYSDSQIPSFDYWN